MENTDSASRASLIDRIKAFAYRHREAFLKKTDDAVKILGLVNFVSFLIYGRYPTILHRVLGVSLTPIIADLLKFDGDKVNFEFQNRQLVWNVMTEFLVFILPLLQLRQVKKQITSFLPKKKADFKSVSQTPVQTRFSGLPVSQCAICIETIERSDIKAASTHVTNAFITNCGHIFCYVCLATRFSAIENGNEDAEGCPRCRLKLTNFLQYGNSVGDCDTDAIMVEYEEVESDSDADPGDEKGDFIATHDSDESAPEDEHYSDQESQDEAAVGQNEKQDFSEMEDLEEDDVMEDDYDDEYDDDDDAFYE